MLTEEQNELKSISDHLEYTLLLFLLFRLLQMGASGFLVHLEIELVCQVLCFDNELQDIVEFKLFDHLINLIAPMENQI